MRRALVLALLTSVSVACAPGPDVDPSVSQQYLVYDWIPSTGAYELHASPIRTLDDPRIISGSVAELRGGGALNIGSTTFETEEDFEDLLEVRNDRTPGAEYFFDGDVVVPFDFDTQMMVTLYHHLERAEEFFGQYDVAPFGPRKAHYFAQLAVFGLPLPLLTDNAAYLPSLDAFLIPPTVVLVDDVPLSANRGVIVHEYSHALFNRLVFGHDASPAPLWDRDFPVQAAEHLRSLDEGVADVFGALATGDSNFISPSITADSPFTVDRDLEVERVWDRALQDELDDEAVGENPYLLGSVIASAIWATREFLDDDVVARTTLEAMRAIAVPTESFELRLFFNAWLAQLDEPARMQAREIFVARFEVIADQIAP